MMRSNKAAGIAAFLAVGFLAACGGGGQQTATTVPASFPTTSAGSSIAAKAATGPTAPVTITVKIPKRTGSSAAVKAAAASNRRGPQYISPGTTSIVATTFPSGSSSGQIACTNQVSCTLTLAATATDTSISVQLYGTRILSTGTAPIALTAGVPSNVTLTLDGVTYGFALTAPTSQLVVNYPTSFTATTQFPDWSTNLIGGPFGNVVDPDTNLILDSTGATINVNSSSSDGSVTLSALAFAAGPPYSLTQTVAYDGTSPVGSPINVFTIENGGDGIASNTLSLQVFSPLTVGSISTAYLFQPGPPAQATENDTLEFADLTPISGNLFVSANYGAFAALPTTLTAVSDTCSGPYISGLSTGPFSGAFAPVSFVISATSPTGNSGCSITLQDNAGPPGPNQVVLNLYIDNAQIFIQGKKRK